MDLPQANMQYRVVLGEGHLHCSDGEETFYPISFHTIMLQVQCVKVVTHDLERHKVTSYLASVAVTQLF